MILAKGFKRTQILMIDGEQEHIDRVVRGLTVIIPSS